MTPEQITERLVEILSNIAGAHILIYRLELAFDAAAKANQTVDVVYSDIWSDAGLDGMHKTLTVMDRQLFHSLQNSLPEHFDRLRSGTP